MVMTAPARSVNAFSRSRTAGISLLPGVHGDLAENGADAVGEGRDKVQGLPVPALRAADRLAVDRDDQPAAGLPGPGPQPRAENLVQDIRADQRERATERRLVRRPAVRAERGQH